jgi:cysteine-rich repeat protein
MREAMSILAAFLLFAVTLGACGDDDTESEGVDAGVDSGVEEVDAAAGDAAVEGGTDAGDGGFMEITCGNGVVDELEECDDGDFDDWNGCTTLCEFTCEADEDCDDLNPCNGKEVCTADNACDDSAPDLEDGEECGPMRSCWLGICVDDVCGDKVVSADEECDDGDLDPNNGCTPDCEWTCKNNADCGGGDECSSSGTCKPDHTCSVQAVADETLCDNGDGWCKNGTCVPYKCGDGIVDKNLGEDCDDGDQNGTDESECSLQCTVTRCGNGIIEGDEQCDDGNDEPLDSCDPECRWELVHRMTRTDVVKGFIPDFCVHQRNRFGEAFSNEVELFPGFNLDVLEQFVNSEINGAINSGEGNAMYHVIDTDDNSLRTIDNDITLGFYDGIRARKWEEGPPLDFPFIIESESVDEDMNPARYHAIPAKQMGGGRIMSSKPSIVEIEGATGRFKMHDYKIRVVFDVKERSTPDGPPDAAKSLKLPETHGYDDPEAANYRPQGVFCGAMSQIASDIPMSGIPAQFCCKQDESMYDACGENEEPPDDCNAYSDVLKEGCWVCINMLDPMSGSDCSRVSEGGCLQIIKPIEFDVDTDGDSENDAWSAVMAFEGKRVRIRGVSEE